MAKSVDPVQTAPIGAVCSGSILFPSLPNWSVMLGNYLQQTTSADDIFRCIFSCHVEYEYFYLSYDVAPGSEIMPCNKIDKPLVVIRFSGNVIMSITTLRA